MKHMKKQTGFTVIEFVIALAIVVILAMIVIGPSDKPTEGQAPAVKRVI